MTFCGIQAFQQVHDDCAPCDTKSRKKLTYFTEDFYAWRPISPFVGGDSGWGVVEIFSYFFVCDGWNKTDYTRGNHARRTGPSPDVGVILAGRRRWRSSIKSALGELNVSRLLENSHVLNMSRKTDRRPPTSNIRDVEPVLF